jgi:nucleoside 2-deoxyribosyltransferase
MRPSLGERVKIYIAGPMTGLPDLNFPKFHEKAAELRARGWEVVSPAEINSDPTTAWQDCMRADIAELIKCDAIFLLERWQFSRGASLEHHIATSLGMKVMYEGIAREASCSA